MVYQKIRYILVAMMLIITGLTFLSPTAFAQTVHVCDDQAEWPPYLYYERVNGEPDKSKLTGATVDLLKAIFREINMAYTLDLLPWKRCLYYVENFGLSKKYEVFTDGSYNDERYEKYYISAPLYKTHNGVFYSKKRFPEGLPFIRASELNKYNLCGVLGYNFEPFTSVGVTAEIDTGAPHNRGNLQKLESQRCDFFLSAIEPVYGGQTIGQHIIPKDIVSSPVPGAKKFTFYLFVAKTSPRAFELYAKINQAIIKLQEKGEAEAIFKKYLPTGTGLR